MRPLLQKLRLGGQAPAQVQSPLTWAATGPVGGACGLTRDIITGQGARGAGMEHQLPRAGDAGAAILRAGPWKRSLRVGPHRGTSYPHPRPSTLSLPCPPPSTPRVSRVLGRAGSMAQVDTPFWGGWHSRWRAVTPPHGSEHGPARPGGPCTVLCGGRGPAGRVGSGCEAGGPRALLLLPLLSAALPATLGSWSPGTPSPGQAAAGAGESGAPGRGSAAALGGLGASSGDSGPARAHMSGCTAPRGSRGPQAPWPCSS